MARPSALTDEISKQICDSLKLGATKKASAESAGIDYATFNNWMKRGAVEKRGKFVKFFKAVGHAEAFCFRNMAATIAKAAADGDWRAAETFLKRRDPENWGDRQIIGGDANKPIVVKSYVTISPDDWDKTNSDIPPVAVANSTVARQDTDDTTDG